MNTENITSSQMRDVSLVYEGYGRFIEERKFEGVSDDDMVFMVAGMVGRRMRTPQHSADVAQLEAVRRAQAAWYADRMIEALYAGLGWWRRLLPLRVRVRIVQAQMDYFKDAVSGWTAELVGMHCEVKRSQDQVRASTLRPVVEPRVSCRSCDRSFVRADFLPKGWTADYDGLPRCPMHPVLVKPEGWSR